jgi:hypothetical protein
LAELAKFDGGWEAFLSQRHLTAYQRVRHFLSLPKDYRFLKYS